MAAWQEDGDVSSWLGSFWSAAEDVWLFYQAHHLPPLRPLPGALIDSEPIWIYLRIYLHVLLGMHSRLHW